MSGGTARERIRRQWRPLLRSFHRDLGYLLVGLTFVYALSGLAVNHIADWDPNFTSAKQVYQMGAPLPADPKVSVPAVLDRLRIKEKVREVYPAAPNRVDVRLEHRTLHLNPQTGEVVEESQRPRFFLRLANWLHLNRGKKAWTLVADFYAAGLLVLAVSGLFMLPGKNGLKGRGAVLVLLGIAIPALYVVLSGGPR